jgi:DNA-binding beta-propeller fold protein YncE
MAMGPDGNLYICSWGNGSIEIVNGITGSPVASIVLPIGGLPNDIAFRPGNNAIHVTAMNTNVGYRYDFVTHMINGMFVGTGWARPHGVTFSPTTGNLLAVDGVTGQVHEFHPVSLVELNPAFLVPAPGDKIVDLEFQPATGPTGAHNTTWGRLKGLYR